MSALQRMPDSSRTLYEVRKVPQKRTVLTLLSSRHNQTQVGTKKVADLSATFRCPT
jgi:hypothetical protein